MSQGGRGESRSRGPRAPRATRISRRPAASDTLEVPHEEARIEQVNQPVERPSSLAVPPRGEIQGEQVSQPLGQSSSSSAPPLSIEVLTRAALDVRLTSRWLHSPWDAAWYEEALRDVAIGRVIEFMVRTPDGSPQGAAVVQVRDAAGQGAGQAAGPTYEAAWLAAEVPAVDEWGALYFRPGRISCIHLCRVSASECPLRLWPVWHIDQWRVLFQAPPGHWAEAAMQGLLFRGLAMLPQPHTPRPAASSAPAVAGVEAGLLLGNWGRSEEEARAEASARGAWGN